MKCKVVLSNVQYVDNVRSIWGAIKVAKKEVKKILSNKDYRKLITDVECTVLERQSNE